MDPATSKPEEAQAQDGMYSSDLFEGDLDIPQEEIDAAYGTSSEVSQKIK